MRSLLDWSAERRGRDTHGNVVVFTQLNKILRWGNILLKGAKNCKPIDLFWSAYIFYILIINIFLEKKDIFNLQNK